MYCSKVKYICLYLDRLLILRNHSMVYLATMFKIEAVVALFLGKHLAMIVKKI